jgi:hypothetical protein
MADGDTPAPDAPPAASTAPSTLPDDHPLVKAFNATKAELAATKEKIKAAEDKDKTELQKALDAAAEKDKALADLPKQVRAQVLRFASTATSKGFLDPEDALTFMPDDVDLSDTKAVESALDALAQRKPHLVKKAKPAGRPKARTGEQPDDEDPTAGKSGKERAAAAMRSLRQ